MKLVLTKWAKVALILSLTIGVMAGFCALINERNSANNMMENVYEKSFYDLLMDVNNI